jgi:hypothetical protein
VIINFWWFKDFALGIYGPVNDHKGWLWRGSWNVSQVREPFRATLAGSCGAAGNERVELMR